MISFAPPARPVPRPTPASDLSAVAFFGRSLAEYARFFPLDPAALRGRPVLDVAAGPSSFTAEACRLGIDAVAVDPLYGRRREALATHVQIDYAKMQRRIRDHPERFRVGAADAYFASIPQAERDRRAAAERFLDDYEAHFAHGRYFGAELPHLPFLNGAFDVVLCAHLLFIYEHLLSYEFHLAACRELVRVSRDEVRIHPVCDGSGEPYRHLDQLRRDLGRAAIEATVVKVDYEFFRGTDTTLILKRASGADDAGSKGLLFRP
jgi:hypothetical protein